jgi:hypothetical protein
MKKLGTGKWLKVCLVFSLVLLPLFLSGCGTSEPPPVWNITGSWYTFYATSGTPGEQGPNLFTFTSTENNITGITSQNQAITGHISGLDITFSWVGSDGATNNSTGTVGSDGSTMSGTWTSSKGPSGTWHAVINITPQASIAGNWNIFETTSGTAGEQGLGLFIFTQSGNGIAGTTPEGQPITGAFGRLDVTFYWVGSDGITNTFTGIVTSDGATMSGSWSSTDGKSGTWRATKS